MKLMKRLNKLITADAHAVMDLIEDPHALLKQAMRDMQAFIEEDEFLLGQISNHLEKLKQHRVVLKLDRDKLNEDLNHCFIANNDDLARSIIKKTLYLVQRIELNHTHLQQVTEKQKKLQARVVDNQQEYQLIAHQAEVLLSEQTLQAKQSKLNRQIILNTVITDDDIEVALLKEKAKRKDS